MFFVTKVDGDKTTQEGLCIKCGKNLNEGSCNCDTFVPDPRMTRILDIYNANKEEV